MKDTIEAKKARLDEIRRKRYAQQETFNDDNSTPYGMPFISNMNFQEEGVDVQDDGLSTNSPHQLGNIEIGCTNSMFKEEN